MSEFTGKLREDTLCTGDREIADLLDALDARLRALEGKFVGTTATLPVTDIDPNIPPITSSSPTPGAGIKREPIIGWTSEHYVALLPTDAVEKAVLAERERCARIVLWHFGGKVTTEDVESATAEIRRGA